MHNSGDGTTCKICGNETKPAFKAEIFGKYTIEYFQCPNCEFVQTEKPYWLQEAYENPINFTDTGIMLRNMRFSKITTSLLFLFFDKKAKYLDYAGGYGIFTRIMRDIGFDFYWDDPYTENLLSKGFEKQKANNYEALTTFESFEHFENPLAEIAKITAISENIIFSTALVPKPLPKPPDWWYYAFEHGQHIAFYSTKTFAVIGEKFGLHYYNISNMHMFTKKKLGFFGRTLLGFRYAKHILYVGAFAIMPFIKSKTASDMDDLKYQ